MCGTSGLAVAAAYGDNKGVHFSQQKALKGH
jgi:hypothetical protein